MQLSFPWKQGLLATMLVVAQGPVLSGTPLLEEDFEGSFPPTGWDLVNDGDTSLGCDWKRSDEYLLDGLQVDSLGAAVDANDCAPAGTPEGAVDAILLTPELDLSSSTDTVLSYDIAYRHFFPTSMATVDASTDGGQSWSTLATYNSSPPFTPLVPEQEVLDLSDYDGESSVFVRWRYTSGEGWWVFVDNVVLGPAGPGIMDIDPLDHDFEELHTGMQDFVELTVSNLASPGHGSFGLDIIDLNGDSDFWILGATCEAGSTVLQPGENCMIRVAFRPESIGQYSAQLQIDTDDGQSATFDVSGEGIPTSAIDVAPGELSAIVDIDDSTVQSFSIGNIGTAALEWFIPEEHGQTAPSGIGPLDGELLREGVLLVHNAGSNSLVALDPEYGDLIDADFIDTDDLGFGSRQAALVHPDGERILLNQQTSPSVIHEFNADGTFLGIFAPVGGEDPTIMENIRGMAFHPDTGNLLVSSASFNYGHAIVELDPDGNYLGEFIDLDALGLSGPWGMYFRKDDLLIALGDEVHVFTHDGDHLRQFNNSALNFVRQITEAANGNVLVTASQGGIWEFDSSGDYVDNYDAYFSTNGVHELPGGTLLVSANTGVHEIDRDNNMLRDIVNGSSNMFSLVQAVDCTIPGWLEVQPLSGTIEVGAAADEVTVHYNAAGLDPGVYEDVLCIESNDPTRPRVQLPVSLTVGQPEGYGSVEGTIQTLGHCGQQIEPLAGASIDAVGSGGEIRQRLTGADGQYQFFMPEVASPIELSISAPGHHGTVVAGVEVVADGTTVENVDLVLDAPCISVTEANYQFDLELGEQVSEVLTIGNLNGGGQLDWSASQGPGLAGTADPRAHFPAEPPRVEHRDREGISIDQPPVQQSAPAELSAGRSDAFEVLAYSTTGSSTAPGYVKLDALVPEALTLINPNQPSTFYAGTFIRNDFNRHYVLASSGGTSPLNTFGYIDTGTGQITELGTVTGAPAVSSWSSLSWDHTSGTLYALGNLDEIYTIDPDSLEATLVGHLHGEGLNPDGAMAVTIAVSPEGLMYAIDLLDNVLLAVDKTTAEAAVIGDLGLDVNFAQDMDFDHRTGTLYWAAYLGTNASRMYIIDPETAELTLIGNVQSAVELLSFSVASAGGGCATPADIPWLSIAGGSGSVAPNDEAELAFTIDTSGMTHGEHEAFVCIDSNDPVEPQVWVPVFVTVTDPDVGFLGGTVTSAGHCGDNPSALADAQLTVTGSGDSYQAVTDSQGQFHLPVAASQGALEIQVSAAEHHPATVSGVSVDAGETTIQDVSMILDAPCFTLDADDLEVGVGPGSSAARALTVGNLDGHAELTWSTDTAGRMGDDTVLMSQNQSTDIWPEHSAGCPLGGNRTLRRFSFADHPGVGDRITSVEFGLADAASSSVVTVNLYTLPATVEENTIPEAELELLDSVAVPVSSANNGSIVSVPFDARVSDINASDLVVEVASGSLYYVGANGAGQSRPGYIVAPGCGFHEPTRLDQIDGFENTHIILMVNAVSGGSCAPPESIPWLTLNPSTGAVPAGESSPLSVEFDADGMSEGDYEAVVCVNSNDVHRPRLEVPVTMSVSDSFAAELEVTPDSLDFGLVPAGTSATLAFSIHNAASAGAEDLVPDSIAVQGDAAFSQVGGTCTTGEPIAPEDSCTVEIGFQPVSPGAFSGQVVIEANGQSAQVALVGEAGEPIDEIFADRFSTSTVDP